MSGNDVANQPVPVARNLIGCQGPWERADCESWRAQRLLEVAGMSLYPYRADDSGRALAPPTYLIAQYLNTLSMGIPDAPVRLNGGNRCRWEQAVYVGDALERQTTVTEVVEKPGRSGHLVLYTLETAYRRVGSGEVAARGWSTAIRRYPRPAGSAPGPGGAERRSHATRSDLAGATEVLQVTPSSRDLVRYAGATDDFYEAHYDQTFARQAGLPGVIVHGLLKLALLARAAIQYAGEGSFVREIEGSYRGIDLAGEPFSVWCEPAGQVGSRTTGNGHDLRIYGSSQAGEVTTVGTAIVEPSPPPH